MLIVETNKERLPEKQYIFSVVFGEYLGIDWTIKETELSDSFRIFCVDHDTELILPNVFFKNAHQSWLSSCSLPVLPLKSFNSNSLQVPVLLIDSILPVLYGLEHKGQVILKEKEIELPIDILGSAFFLLSRYEELVITDRDEHDRFIASQSISFRAGILRRPIIDEYIEVLWVALSLLFPSLERKKRHSSPYYSCDVDRPIYTQLHSFKGTTKKIAKDISKKAKFSSIAATFSKYIAIKRSGDSADPLFKFTWIMDQLELNNIRGAFYFITGHTSPLDGDYSIQSRRIHKLLDQIHIRGHEIGLHTSYNSAARPILIKDEFERLKGVCRYLNIKQEKWGGRQHYLRWIPTKTWTDWDDAGLNYDATLGYAEQVGFRTGTMFEYSAYDLVKRKKLQLLERPLSIMETTLFGSNYMNIIDHRQVYDEMMDIINACKLLKGPPSLLWHNNNLVSADNQNLFKSIVSSI